MTLLKIPPKHLKNVTSYEFVISESVICNRLLHLFFIHKILPAFPKNSILLVKNLNTT